MPYKILHLPKGGYRVVNSATREVKAKRTSKRKAEAQVRLLTGLERG